MGNEVMTMIDKIIGYDGQYPVYRSDVYIYENYIGYEDKDGNIYMYDKN